MLEFDLPSIEAGTLRVLCLGAHADDIEIGCGGTLLWLKSVTPLLRVTWVVFCTSGVRRSEAAAAAETFTSGCDKDVILKEFRDGFLPHSGTVVKEFFEELHNRVEPHLIFTHWRNDAHQDHRLLSELTWNTFRNHLVLEYEIPKYDGDLGQPNVFVPLSEDLCKQKLSHVFDAFKSQSAKRWFDRRTFLGLMRLRGMECNSLSGYAEGFHARKVVLGSHEERGVGHV